MAKSKRYPLVAFMNEFSTEAKCREYWQICGGQADLFARNAAAATLVCYPMVVINVPTAAGKPQ